MQKTTTERVLQAARDYMKAETAWVEALNFPRYDCATDGAVDRLRAGRRAKVDEAITMFEYTLCEFVDERIAAAGEHPVVPEEDTK